jgi:hypothetical protein
MSESHGFGTGASRAVYTEREAFSKENLKGTTAVTGW